jgi:cytochrome c oxidase cbb3-type subunit 3/ubiquinol-cytochrome c reductase cytochrome c subunit
MRASLLYAALVPLLAAAACGPGSAADGPDAGDDAALPPADAGDAGAPPADASRDASGDAPAPDASDDDAATPPPSGAALYATHCALCHGAEGEGYAADDAPAITNPDFLQIAGDAFFHAAIYDGRPGTPMSAWGDAHGGPLSRSAVDAIVAFLRGYATLPFEDVSTVTVAGDASRGASIYAAQCARCHGDAGEGGRAPTLDNPVFQDTVSDGFLLRSVERGRRGTAMNGFAALLTESELADVVAFVRTLRRAPMPEWPVEDPPAVDRLVLHPTGEAPAFTLREGRYVPAADVHAALRAGRRMVLLDARAASDWALGHIPGAAPFPFYSVDDLAAHLPNDGTFIIAYCGCPHAASGRVVDQLRARGFAATAVLDEGIYHWQDAGYPMARGRLP